MNRLSIILIDNQISSAVAVTQTIAIHLSEYRLNIVRDIATALREREPVHIILLNLSSEMGEHLDQLKQKYRHIPLILLQRNQAANQALLLKALKTEDSEYLPLSAPGLLSLGRRLQDHREKTWLQQLTLEHERHNQELQVLLETSRQISGQLELRATLNKITEQAKLLLNADTCHIYFLEQDNHTLRPVISIGPNADRIHAIPLRIENNLIGACLPDDKATMINALGTTPLARKTFPPFTTGMHLLCVPITASQGLIGAMIATRTHPNPFSEDDLRFFENLVDQAASLINNARQFEEAQRNLNALSVLYEASASISTTWDTQTVLNILIRQMVQAMNISSGRIIRWNKQQQQGIVQAEFVSEDILSPQTGLGSTFSLAERPAVAPLIHQKEILFFQTNDPDLEAVEQRAMEQQGCLTRLLVPLIIKGESVGWAELWATGRERYYTESEIRLIQMLANQAAVAMENAQYLKQTGQALEETMALYEVASTLSATRDSQTIISTVLHEYLQTLNLKQGSVLIFDFDLKQAIVKVHFQDEEITTASAKGLEGRQISLRTSPIYIQLRRRGQPLEIEDTQAAWLFHPSQEPSPQRPAGGWAGSGALSMLVIPIRAQGEIIGALVAEETRHKRTFDQWEISLGQAMADQLSIALQNAQLYELEYYRRRQAETLREVSYVVGSSLNLEEVLERVLDQLGRVISYDSAAIHLLEGKSRRIIAGRGLLYPEETIGLKFPAGLNKHEPGSIVIHSRMPIVVKDVNKYETFKNRIHAHIKSWMGIPLIARDKVIGLISVDHIKPNAYNEEDIELAMAFANQVAIALENARLHEIEVREFEQELEIAARIQESLLPQAVPSLPGLEIASRLIPARQVGGDFFHFFSVGHNQLGLAIGDVSGKGIPASLFMAVVMTAIDAQVNDNSEPSQLLNKLHHILYNRLQENRMNVGLQVATFTPPEKQIGRKGSQLMAIASGGMISPIIATPYGSRFLPVSGFPVGAPMADLHYDESYRLLEPGTAIIFTSDGIVEAQNAEGELFGFERLEAVATEIIQSQQAEAIVDYIFSAVREFTGETEQKDDMTVVVVLVKP